MTCGTIARRCIRSYFNPHSRKGSDNGGVSYSTMLKISTHTPARGVTVFNEVIDGKKTISTHTPARGVTYQVPMPLLLLLFISTHTPARGVTLLS